MYRLLNAPINKNKTIKTYFIFLLLFCALPVLLNTLLFVPKYASLVADVVYEDSFIVVAIRYAQDLLDLCAFAVAYSLIIFSMLLLDVKHTRLVVIFYAIIFLLQIPLKLVVNAVVYGTLGNDTEILIDVLYLLVYFVLQMIQLLAVYLASRSDSIKFKAYVDSLGSSVRKVEEPKKILPFARLFDWNNPLQRSSAKMSMIIFGIKIFTRIINDVTYGTPESAGEILIMVVYYLTDILYGIVAYLLAVLAISVLYDRIKKKDEEISPSQE